MTSHLSSDPAAAPSSPSPAHSRNVVQLPVFERDGERRVVRRIGRPAPISSVQGSLALDLDVPPAPSAIPGPDRALLAPRPGLLPIGGQEPDPLEAWATQFAQALVEVAAGTRPALQLLRATSGDVYADLQRRYQLLTASGTRVRSVRHARPRVRSVHVSRTHVHAAELSVVVQQGERCRAIAIAVQRREGRWQAVDVQFG